MNESIRITLTKWEYSAILDLVDNATTNDFDDVGLEEDKKFQKLENKISKAIFKRDVKQYE